LHLTKEKPSHSRTGLKIRKSVDPEKPHRAHGTILLFPAKTGIDQVFI
jgi:hypothetical protein